MVLTIMINVLAIIFNFSTGVLNLSDMDEQTVLLDVMPLVNGYLPLPSVRLSKYIPAGSKSSSGKY